MGVLVEKEGGSRKGRPMWGKREGLTTQVRGKLEKCARGRRAAARDRGKGSRAAGGEREARGKGEKEGKGQQREREEGREGRKAAGR